MAFIPTTKKPEKIFLNNANLMYALSGKISEGTMRETFRKTFDQIADLPNSYLAVDNIEIGNGNRIPLWMFGCLY